MAKVRQDKALDNIEKGLGVLKGLGEAMGENLGQQDVLLSEIDSKARQPHPPPPPHLPLPLLATFTRLCTAVMRPAAHHHCAWETALSVKCESE